VITAPPAGGYPLGRREREVLRAYWRGQYVGQAVRQARLHGRTIACQGIDHPWCVGAVGCLCDCHDPRGDPRCRIETSREDA
jgi:hypothetical protein